MSLLHPKLEPGEFNLVKLLEHKPPITWRPEEVGEFIIGCVHRVLTARRRDYEFPVLEMLVGTGDVVRVNCSTVMLRNAIEDVKPGNVVRIELGEKKVSRAGREYKTHKVQVMM